MCLPRRPSTNSNYNCTFADSHSTMKVRTRMLATKISILFLLFIVLQQCNARVTSFTKSIHQPTKQLIFDGRTTRDPRLHYAVCDSSTVAKKCMVIRDKEPYEKGIDECEVILRASDNDGKVKQVRVLPFGQKRAILLWYEQTNSESILGLTSVKFSDCSTHEVRTPFFDDSIGEEYLLEVVDAATYEDSYDVAFKYPKVCGDKYCKLSVDVEKNVTQGPVAWISAEHHGIVDINAVDSSSRDKGILISQIMPNSFFRISLVGDNGYKVLKHYKNSEITPPISMESSCNNDLIGVCILMNGTLKCSQYNNSGIITFEFEQLHKDAALVAMYNLHQGLLILVNDLAETHRYWILKLDSRGNVLSLLNVKGIDCDQSLNFLMGIFYEKDGKYCFSTTCFESYEHSATKKDKGHLDKTTQCFSIDDFVAAP